MRPVAAYTMCYGVEFAEPERVGAYDATIDDYATAVVRACTEAAHKAKRANRGTYKTARHETVQFVLVVINYTRMQELRDPETFYTDVAPKALLAHLQVGCTVQHTLNLLVLHNKMQSYHLEVQGIPEYINMLKDAQKQAGRAGRTIADETLILFASTEMLTTKRYHRANNNWEDRA